MTDKNKEIQGRKHDSHIQYYTGIDAATEEDQVGGGGEAGFSPEEVKRLKGKYGKEADEYLESIKTASLLDVPSESARVCQNCDSETPCCMADCELFERAVEYAEIDAGFDPCKGCHLNNEVCPGIDAPRFSDRSYSLSDIEDITGERLPQGIRELILKAGIEDKIGTKLMLMVKNRNKKYSEFNMMRKIISYVTDYIIRNGTGAEVYDVLHGYLIIISGSRALLDGNTLYFDGEVPPQVKTKIAEKVRELTGEYPAEYR